MDAQRKALQSLTVSLDERRQELQETYRNFGEAIFSDSANPSVPLVALSQERSDSWRELMSARERDATAILDIRTAMTRKREIEQFKRELAATSAALDSEYGERLAVAGKAMFENYSEDYAPWFSSAYEKASVEGAALMDLERRKDALRRELEETGFLGKMVSQLRMNGVEASVRRQRDRISEILAEGARSLAEGGGFDALRESGKMTGELAAAVESVIETGDRIRSLGERALSMEAELAASAETLAARGAEGNAQRRVEELGARVRDADRRIETLCVLAARDYCDTFMDETGIPLAGDRPGDSRFGDAGTYARQLGDVSSLRGDIRGIRRSIESLETSMKIESLERSVQAMKKNVADCERKMASLETQAASMREAIASASAEREELIARKAEIDKTMA